MEHVARSVHLSRPTAEVWNLIGGFQALPDWHPAVEASHAEQRDGAEHRRLILAGGGEILERLIGFDDGSYAYAIVEGPLPVSDYRATLTAAEVGGGTVVTWSSTFAPTAADARATIAGIYEAGFEALGGKLGG